MSNLSYLFFAFFITWIVIAGYLWMLGRQVQNLKDDIETLTEGVDLKADSFETVERGSADSPAASSSQG